MAHMPGTRHLILAIVHRSTSFPVAPLSPPCHCGQRQTQRASIAHITITLRHILGATPDEERTYDMIIMGTGYEQQSWLHMLDEDSFGNVFGFSNRPSSSGFAKANHSDRGDSGKVDAEGPQEIYAPLSPPTTTGAASSQSCPSSRDDAAQIPDSRSSRNMSPVGGTQPLDERLPSGSRSIASFTLSHHPPYIKEACDSFSMDFPKTCFQELQGQIMSNTTPTAEFFVVVIKLKPPAFPRTSTHRDRRHDSTRSVTLYLYFVATDLDKRFQWQGHATDIRALIFYTILLVQRDNDAKERRESPWGVALTRNQRLMPKKAKKQVAKQAKAEPGHSESSQVQHEAPEATPSRLDDLENMLKLHSREIERLQATNQLQACTNEDLVDELHTVSLAAVGDWAAINKIRNRVLLDMAREKLA
ncbi:hypothetical protein BS47DRAFT_1389361 [Hydnum rufescens UP504]|uniref:Uncharacterized protein n=1 Tax=Hydnum rufescens UP504 TaxID=1448309 RepID=A0A9P6B5A1_9AGAM|nr:hypothetical protein BS47DRAFT_1389361 [Hydnum rufescens UP504]